jgi:zinc transport system substrate-binding protein
MRIILMLASRVCAVVGALALAAPLLAGCGALTGAEGSSKPSVVTSFYPLAFVAERIVGDHAQVRDLTHPGQEPHDIEMTVRQTAELADADVVVYERGFQAAVDDAVDQSSHDHVVDASATGDVVGDDPHFWLDPTRLSRVADAVEKQVAAADPAHRRVYQRNLRALRRDLRSIDAAFQRGLASCRITTIVASHDAFGYLGRRYGLRVVGINGLSPDAEPSPAHIRQLQDLISEDGITTVFSERLASRKLADSLAGDLGLHTAVLDPVEGLSDATADQDYLSLMRHNLSTLREANQCT